MTSKTGWALRAFLLPSLLMVISPFFNNNQNTHPSGNKRGHVYLFVVHACITVTIIAHLIYRIIRGLTATPHGSKTFLSHLRSVQMDCVPHGHLVHFILCSGVNWTESETNHSPPSNVDVKYAEITLPLLYKISWRSP